MAQQREGRLVNEWLWKTYPTKLQWKRVRLGQTPNKVEAAYYKVLLRWADAIVINDMDVVIIEGKIRPGFGALGQLEAYKELFNIATTYNQTFGLIEPNFIRFSYKYSSIFGCAGRFYIS